MVTFSSAFTVIGLGTTTPKYLWNGVELRGVIKMFVYKGISITLSVADKSILPLVELKAYGIKIKEI